MDANSVQSPVSWWEERWVETSGASNSPLNSDSDGLPKHLGAMAGMERDLGRGLHIYTLAAKFHSPMRSVYTSLKAEPYLWFAVSLAGKGSYDNGGKLAGDVAAGGAYCSLLQDHRSLVSYAPGVHSAGGFAITRDRLAQLLEGQAVDGPIRSFLNGTFDPMVAHFRSTPETRTILNQLFNHPYTGPMEAIYLEAKAYELLAENLRLLADQGSTAAISRARRHAHEARALMMADLAHPPSIGEVARQVGLSQRALANVFHEVFGASPLKCLTTWRLEAAQGLLHSGAYSVKQVAHLMGYAHPSSFSQAFIRQYGRPPTGFQDT